jgi:hypothetical protein
MTKEKVLQAMEEANAVMATRDDWCLCIPSYTRPDFVLGRLLKKCTKEFIRTHIYVFVHQDELDDYKQFNPELNYEVVPESCYGLGYTRDYINCWSVSKGLKLILNWDDDIKNLTFMYASKDCYGNPSTKHSSREDERNDPIFTQKILCYTAYIADYLFATYPNLRVGNIRRQRFCGDVSVHQTLAHINKGATPRQTNIWNLKGYIKGLYLPESARWHGEDIITAARVLEEGEQLFSIQQVGYDFVSEQISSVVRDTDENSERNRKLHAKEYQDLQAFEIRKYLKAGKTYPDGSYMYGDVDWRRFYALHPDRKGFSIKVE